MNPGTVPNRNGWSRRWHPWAALAMAAAGVLATFDAWSDIARIGTLDEESSHVLLVPAVVGWLVWVRRGRLRHCKPDGKWVGTLMIAAGWLLWSYGYSHEVQSFWHGGAVLVAAGAGLTVLGRDVFIRFLPAFGALLFLIPVPGRARYYVAQPLQTATAQVTQSVCEVLGMRVARQANLLTINGTNVAIAEACNGMRMVFTLFLVCYTFAFVTALRGYVRVLVLAASPLTAVVCNVVRLVPAVWMYGHTSPAAADRFHDVAGWVMLGVAFVVLMGITRVLRWAMLPVTPFNLATTAVG